jgi:hypothetical protein
MWLWECQKCLAAGESEDKPGNPCGCESEFGECDGELVSYYIQETESQQ